MSIVCMCVNINCHSYTTLFQGLCWTTALFRHQVVVSQLIFGSFPWCICFHVTDMGLWCSDGATSVSSPVATKENGNVTEDALVMVHKASPQPLPSVLLLFECGPPFYRSGTECFKRPRKKKMAMPGPECRTYLSRVSVLPCKGLNVKGFCLLTLHRGPLSCLFHHPEE